ncbi:MAG: hypothetical protein CR975_03290 [Gammaproteobacteria bacterium]|nr:MAG: hypothetical protein CR975_03290 [Gammaproteobacteria bacterium]
MQLQKYLVMTLALGLGPAALALTVSTNEYTCPIGGEKFTATVPASGTSFGTRTDLKPYGPIQAPWTIPQCPTNKFVMFKEDFTAEELATFKQIIESDAYKAIPENSSEYYYLAKLYEGSKASHEKIAWAYLKASWEMGGKDVLQNALNHFEKSLLAIKASDKNAKDKTITHNMLIGELNRLLGNFTQARKHFEMLKADKLYTDKAYLLKIIELELKLIEEKNTYPEEINKS